MRTEWYGKRYPFLHEMEAFAESMGAAVAYGNFPAAFLPEGDGGPIIFLPARVGALEQIWLLAHEIGHLLHHTGHAPLKHSQQEFRADHWAARALIPFDRIMAHLNASEDAFIGALSAHYEDLPLEDCPARHLAAEIARIRLEALSLEVA